MSKNVSQYPTLLEMGCKMRTIEELTAQYIEARRRVKRHERELSEARGATALLKLSLKRRGAPIPPDDIPHIGANLRPRPKTLSELRGDR